MKNTNDIPPGKDMTFGLCETVAHLIPTYSEAADDHPDNLLSNHPDSSRIIEVLKILIDVLLPGRMSPDAVAREDLGIFLTRRLSHGWRLLRPEIERALPFRWTGAAAQTEGPPAPSDPKEESLRTMKAFYDQLPEIRKLVVEDIRAAYEGDPAALTYAEVQLAYPGLLAVASHRLSNALYGLNVPIIPRIMSEWTHSETGVDINPGATIGHGLFIDHATGVVIGETAIIGNRVKIYQGVTLGAKSFPLDAEGNPIKHVKRHPTVGDRAIIYANSTILGDIEIGADSTIGGNVFLTKSVPENTLVVVKHSELTMKKGEE